MKDRYLRLKTIKNLIKSNKIESQDVLLDYLLKEGFEVTQATLSRDLKLMKVGKVSDGNNGYVYTIPDDEIVKESDQVYAQDFLRGYISIDFSRNICVIKTLGGYAHSVTNALDSMNLEEILGTIAGENCIFVCLRENVTPQAFMTRLKEKIPGLEG